LVVRMSRLGHRRAADSRGRLGVGPRSAGEPYGKRVMVGAHLGRPTGVAHAAPLLSMAGTSGSEAVHSVRTPAPERYPVFDSLRIIAAVVVIFSHAFPLSGHPEPVVTFLGHYGLTFGALAVATFFIISGFLITMSWTTSPRTVPYSVKRVARIWP